MSIYFQLLSDYYLAWNRFFLGMNRNPYRTYEWEKKENGYYKGRTKDKE